MRTMLEKGNSLIEEKHTTACKDASPVDQCSFVKYLSIIMSTNIASKIKWCRMCIVKQFYAYLPQNIEYNKIGVLTTGCDFL